MLISLVILGFVKMISKGKSLHFKYHRCIEYLKFWIRLPYHIIFHEFDPYGEDGYQGYNIKGFIICGCGFVEDLGMSYGQHCEKCYNETMVKEVSEK